MLSAVIHLAFRLDDPSPTSDHALEREILERFRATGFPLTCAVVPYSCGGGDERPLAAGEVSHLVDARREGVLEVALHGYCHRCLTRLSDGNSSEFSGVEASRQREALARGKARLEAVFATPVTGFVPPWNSYDATTLRLLDEIGFSYLSADWALVGEDALPFPVIPHTCNLIHLQEAVADAREFPAAEPAVVVILHHFDFAESGSGNAGTDLDELARLLAWVGDRPDIACSSLGGLAARFGPETCRRNLTLARWRSGLHWRLQRLLPRYALLNGSNVRFAYAVGRRALQRLPRLIAA